MSRLTESYIDFSTTSKYGHVTLTNPILTSETVWAAIKVELIDAGVSQPNVFTFGQHRSGYSCVFLGFNISDSSVRVARSNNGTFLGGAINNQIAGSADNGAPHIFLLKIENTRVTLYIDNTTPIAGSNSVALAHSMSRMILNARQTGDSTYNSVGRSRVYWTALYSSEPDIAALMAGANPQSCGTLRSGNSLYPFLGDALAYGTNDNAMTLVGSPEFYVPPAAAQRGLISLPSQALVTGMTESIISR